MTALAGDARARLASLPAPALWLIAARLKTVSLSQVPVLAGAWRAGEGFRLDVTVAAMIATATIQIGTNLWNDAADAARGVDQPDRLGPPRMTALGLLDGAAVRRAALASFGLATLAGLWLVTVGGWPIVGIGLVVIGDSGHTLPDLRGGVGHHADDAAVTHFFAKGIQRDSSGD